MSCLKQPFKQLYDSFVDRCFLGGYSDVWFLPYESIEQRNACVTTGYAVNKDPSEITKCRDGRHSFKYQVLDHIRVIEEILSGIYKVDNQEFQHINHIFLREFMLSSIYVIYSEEFRDYELKLAKELAEKGQEDPVERYERSYPDCSFRLLRRVAANEGGWRWDAVLSGVQNIEIDEYLPKDGDESIQPLRFSFNEGILFMRLYQIFSQYEAQLQTYKLMFNALHKVGDITGEDVNAITTKQKQFESPSVFTSTAIHEKAATTTVENLELVQHITLLKESYDSITTALNDSLARLGFAGDDSTKAERVTTGENFRALQPNMAFQQAILNRLECVTDRIRNAFKQDVLFNQGIQPNEQGIPVNEDSSVEDKEPNVKEDAGKKGFSLFRKK